MKHIHNLVLTGLMIHFLPLNAESTDTEEFLAPTDMVAENEEAALTSLDEELSLLDEEFQEFKEEIAELETTLEQQDAEVAASEIQIDPITLEAEPLPFEMLLEEPSSAVAQPEVQVQLTEEIPAVAIAEQPAPVSEPAAVAQAPAELPQATETPPPAFSSIARQPTVEQEAPATLVVESASLIGEPAPLNDDSISVDLQQAFAGSPLIYTLLFGMSVFSVGIWFYAIASIRTSAKVPGTFAKNVENRLNSNQFEEALSLCQENNNLFSKMVRCGIQARRHGLPVMIDAMKAEGKRSSISFWQKIGLLNDIAIIAPMLGLLGTVMGMFYAFYDVNRSIESISTLFDGLGISVGTTVAGLVVAILALILHSTAKYRLVKTLAQVENEAHDFAALIDDRTSISKG